MISFSNRQLAKFLNDFSIVRFVNYLQSQQIKMKESLNFSFKEMQKKYLSKEKKKQKQEEDSQRLVLYEDLVVNPLVVEECNKIEKDYVTYYNNNRYFYLHNDPENINTLQKIKNDEFNQIRKEYEKTLVIDRKDSEKIKENVESPKKRNSKTDKQMRFRHLSYLFRKNVKIIISKLKSLKLTVKVIFEKKLFTPKPYLFGKQIFEAVKFGDDTKVWRYYIQNKFVVYSIDSSGKTPLVWACTRGFSVLADMLIGMGSLINKKDILGHTALYYAINYQHSQCVKILVLNDAAISPQDVALSTKDKKIKNIVQLGISIMPIIKRIPYEKRTNVFQERLRQFK